MKSTSLLIKILVIGFSVLLTFSVAANILLIVKTNKLNNKILEQQETISSDQATISSLEQKTENQQDLIDELYGKVEWEKDKFNYLAIGNSITLHGVCDYWWDLYGMAASDPEHDYVHVFANLLDNSMSENVFFRAINFSTWETNSHDRAQTLESILPYLSHRLDLVTIQLSENVSNVDTFENDFNELVTYIEENAKNAEIMVIDDFWFAGNKSDNKRDVALQHNVDFISLAEIKGVAEYQCGMGTLVQGNDGKQHAVDHAGVAAHPGDKGMEYIAQHLFSAYQS